MVRRAACICALLLLVRATAGAATPGAWTALHPGDAVDAEPGLARTGDGRLHVVWPSGGVSRSDLLHRVISPAGATIGATDFVTSGWQTIEPQVDLVAARSELRAVWAGSVSAQPGQAAMFASSSSGSAWSVPAPATAAITGTKAAGAGAALMQDGTLAVAHGDATIAGTNRVRVGAGTETVFETAGCCASEPDLAVDANSGKVFLAWFSTAPGKQGIWTQEVSTNGLVGARARVAGSSSTDGSAAVPPGQRTAITARIGAGGVFVAYGAGYPAFMSVNLLRIGRAPLVVARSDRIEHVGVASGPEGRLWLFWSRGDGYLVTRSNRAATRFESVTRVSLPAADATTFGLYGEGSGGPLDLVAHAGSGTAIPDWHTQVLPRLSLAVVSSRTEVRGKRTVRRLSLRVADAGDAVGGARITLAGKRFTTASSGRVTAVLPATGKQAKAMASKPGYASAIVRVRL